MNTPPNDATFTFNSTATREKVREEFLAACQGASNGTVPNPDDYLADFPDAERSQLRAELDEVLRNHFKSSSKGSSVGAAAKATVSNNVAETKQHTLNGRGVATVHSNGTNNHFPSHDQTVDQPSEPVARLDFVSSPDETLDQPDPNTGTLDFVAVMDKTGEFSSSPTETMEHSAAPDATGDFSSEAPTGEFPAHESPSREKPNKRSLLESVAGYEILKVLGRGAMGVVYKARQRGLKRLVALKMILSGEHASEQDLARFQAEANAVALLQHPGIVQIYEIGEDNGRPFFSLEFVDGLSLHKKLQESPMAPREAAELMHKMADAMAYAHQRGIIHRDLKPANVLLTSDGIPKIGDFGLAKSIDDDESGITRTGTVMGTPSYMSPEQGMGLTAEIGPLADVYSLGAMLYDMLTGRPPFRGTSVMDTLQQLKTREPVPPIQLQPNVPRDLETICLKCLQKEKHKRYASASALADDLQRFLDGRAILARPISKLEQFWRFCRRNPKETIAATIILLIIFGFSIALGIQNGKLEKKTEEALTAKGEAETNEAEAKRLEGVAKEEKQKAEEQKGIAEVKKQEAETAKGIAEEKKKEAEKQIEIQKRAIGDTMGFLRDFVILNINVLQSKRFSLDKNPEIQKLRVETLDNLQKKLNEIVAITRQKLTADTNADLMALQLMGDLLLKLGQKDEPLKLYQQGFAASTKLVEKNPNRDIYRYNLGVLEQRLGDVPLQTEGDARDALKHYLISLGLHEEIQRNPKSNDFPPEDMDRAVAHDDMRVGKALLSLGRAAEAKKYFEEALRYYTAWSKSPKNKTDEPRSYMMEANMLLGIAASRLADAPGVDKWFTAAMSISREILPRNNRHRAYLIDQADVEGAYGDALLMLGKPAEARKLYSQSLDDLKEAYAKVPEDVEHQALLARAYDRMGIVSQLLKQPEEAKPFIAAAKQLWLELFEMERKNIARQAALVVAWARVSDYKAALSNARVIRGRMEKSPELMIQVARCFAISARANVPLGEKNSQPALGAMGLSFVDETRKAQLKKNIVEALSALSQATKDDFKDAAVLLTDPDFEILRDEPAFKELIAKLKAR